jgi:hypothetical protein
MGKSGRMSQGYFVIITKILHIIGIECHCIIHDDIDRAPESRQDIGLQELNDNCVGNLPCGDHFDPFGEIVCGR